MKTLYIDPSKGGISGEALAAALADLTGKTDQLRRLAETLSSAGEPGCFSVTVEKLENGTNRTVISTRNGIAPPRPGDNTRQVLEDVLAGITTDDRTRSLAHEVLAEVETAARNASGGLDESHRSPREVVFGILGPLIMLESLGTDVYRIESAPPAIGQGVGATSYAIALDVFIRHRIPFIPSPDRCAVTTPEGAALLAVLADVGSRFSPVTPVRAGYGCIPSEGLGDDGILAVVEGEVQDLIEDRIVMLETNLDDIPGEVIGYTMERLFAAGAVDVFLIPALGKKNRPVQMISVITSRSDYTEHLRILMEETGTLGVRVREVPRLVADREKVPVPVVVSGRNYRVRVKTSKAYGRTIAVKPEYEDLKIISRELNLPLRYVTQDVMRQVSGGVYPAETRDPET